MPLGGVWAVDQVEYRNVDAGCRSKWTGCSGDLADATELRQFGNLSNDASTRRWISRSAMHLVPYVVQKGLRGNRQSQPLFFCHLVSSCSHGGKLKAQQSEYVRGRFDTSRDAIFRCLAKNRHNITARGCASRHIGENEATFEQGYTGNPNHLCMAHERMTWNSRAE